MCVLIQVKPVNQDLKVSVENGERMDSQAETATQDHPDREESPDSLVLPDNLVLQENEDKTDLPDHPDHLVMFSSIKSKMIQILIDLCFVISMTFYKLLPYRIKRRGRTTRSTGSSRTTRTTW